MPVLHITNKYCGINTLICYYASLNLIKLHLMIVIVHLKSVINFLYRTECSVQIILITGTKLYGKISDTITQTEASFWMFINFFSTSVLFNNIPITHPFSVQLRAGLVSSYYWVNRDSLEFMLPALKCDLWI